MARPYSDQVRETILNRVADGEFLVAICRDEGMPSARQVQRWINSDEAFAVEYHLSRVVAAHGFAQQAQELVDSIVDRDTAIAARAKFEVLRWAAGTHAPRVYGEKLDLALDVKVDVVGILERRRQAVLDANARAGVVEVPATEVVRIGRPQDIDDEELEA